jgi:hypothetical protein
MGNICTCHPEATRERWSAAGGKWVTLPGHNHLLVGYPIAVCQHEGCTYTASWDAYPVQPGGGSQRAGGGSQAYPTIMVAADGTAVTEEDFEAMRQWAAQIRPLRDYADEGEADPEGKPF